MGSSGRDSGLGRTRPANPEGDEWTAMLLGALAWCEACQMALAVALPEGAPVGAEGAGAEMTAEGPATDPVLDCLLGVIATGRHLRRTLSAAAPPLDPGPTPAPPSRGPVSELLR